MGDIEGSIVDDIERDGVTNITAGGITPNRNVGDATGADLAGRVGETIRILTVDEHVPIVIDAVVAQFTGTTRWVRQVNAYPVQALIDGTRIQVITIHG
jgi:hypothetical protein